MAVQGQHWGRENIVWGKREVKKCIRGKGVVKLRRLQVFFGDEFIFLWLIVCSGQVGECKINEKEVNVVFNSFTK